jgi:hypothetical protein
VVLSYRTPVKFDQIDAVQEAIKDIVENEAASQKVDASHIAVDVTGGQVVASIGGALATIDEQLVIQYVGTFVDRGPDPTPGCYDLVTRRWLDF